MRGARKARILFDHALKLRQICAIRIDLLKERGLLVIERCEAFACFQIRELLLGIGEKLVRLICLPLEETKCPAGVGEREMLCQVGVGDQLKDFLSFFRAGIRVADREHVGIAND